MNADNNNHLTRKDSRGVVLATLLFMLASAVLHFVLGGALRPVKWDVAPTPSVTSIWEGHLQTPRPSPTPKPQPSPTPAPKIPQPQPKPQMTIIPVVKPIVQPVRPVVPPIALATDGSGTGELSPPPVSVTSIAPSAPPDDRYIIVSARFIHRAVPDYPSDAVSAGEEGTVIILLTIGPEGVSDVRVWQSSGYASLDREALRAAKESTYSIPEVNGEPATETYRVIYTFSLNSYPM